MNGAGGVVALILLEWTVGGIAAAAWTQSWTVVRRGHFKIVAWSAVITAALAVAASRAVLGDVRPSPSLQMALIAAFVVTSVLYLLVQYSRTDAPGTAVGAAAGAIGGAALVATADLISGWPQTLGALELLAGALLLGAVTNGMLLGHWYLNQPGLQPWALARLTDLALAAVAFSGLLGAVAAGRLIDPSRQDLVLAVPGLGASFSLVLFVAWLALLAFTGLVVLGARRCVKLRSIQSATGLLYVAILSAGVAEFLVRYLMVTAS